MLENDEPGMPKMMIAIVIFLLLLLIWVMFSASEQFSVQKLPEPWTTDLVKNNPTWLFLFEDNDLHTNKYDNIRYMANTKGIPVGKTSSIPYVDSEIDSNRSKISSAIGDILNDYSGYDQIILPNTPIGQGISSSAPLTYQYIQYRIGNLIHYLKA